MDIEWGSQASHQFITNIGLITTTGPIGDNIMAAEWTHHVSYKPGHIAVSISKHNHATAHNIRQTKEFGVNIASLHQDIAASVAGGNTGKEIDKIASLKELGFSFYAGKKIKSLMVQDASLNVECKLVNEVDMGSHILFIGEALAVNIGTASPLAFQGGKYWQLTTPLQKPTETQREHIQAIVSKHRKK